MQNYEMYFMSYVTLLVTHNWPSSGGIQIYNIVRSLFVLITCYYRLFYIPTPQWIHYYTLHIIGFTLLLYFIINIFIRVIFL